MSQAIQKKYYSIEREHTYLRYQEDDFYSKNLIAHLVNFTGISKQDRILEIGAGAGRFTIHLLKAGYNVDCVDISEAQLTRLREDAVKANISKDRIRTHCMSIENMAFDSTNRYDVMIGFFILHHLDIDNLEPYFLKFKQLLTSKGRICYLEPNRLNPLYFLQILLQKDMDFQAEKGLYMLSKRKLRETVSSTRDSSVDFKNFGFFPPQIVNRFPRILKLEKALEKLLLFNKLLPFLLIRIKTHQEVHE